jgi:hypothetical protein
LPLPSKKGLKTHLDMIFSLFILNKAGQLIYQKNWTPFALPLAVDDFLQVAGVFHAMYLLSAAISPAKESSGIQLIESDKMVLRCLQSHTGMRRKCPCFAVFYRILTFSFLYIGTKFFVTADPNQRHLEELLHEIYDLYIDYALKNPFYDMEQPIQNVCEKFVTNLESLISTIQKGGAPRSVGGSVDSASSTTGLQ